MSDISIFRPASEDEKKDFIELTHSRKSVMNLFLGKLADKQQECQRNHLPFCSHCARLDFDKKVRDVEIDVAATAVSKTANTTTNVNFNQYTGLDKFEMLDTKPIKEVKLLDGLKTTAIIGKRFTMKCKNRGCGLVMDIENEDLEEALKVLKPSEVVVEKVEEKEVKKEDKK